MTFFKQIASLLSAFLIIILITVMGLNFKSANDSIQDRLYEDAKNTATSLSLSLGGANGDLSMMETMINANFDSGEYALISLVDVDGKVLYERKNESTDINVPNWFLHAIKIEAPTAAANVSAGWSQVGILYVQSDVTYAYEHLYEILKNLVFSFAILIAVGLVILNIILAAAMKPLKKVQLQAEAVTKNEFIIQDEIPKTKEFRDVVLGMNNMVTKVKAMFDKANEELKRQKELEYTDQTTKLKNRKFLIDKLPQYLKIDAEIKGGSSIMVALSGVIEANEAIGHKNVDELFVKIANVFREQTKQYKEAIIARMNGTEFCLFLPNCENGAGLEVAQNIKNDVDAIIRDASLDNEVTYISIGIYEYNHKQSIGEVLSLSDNALTQAKFNKTHIHLERAKDGVEIMGKDAWRQTISKALETNGFGINLWKVANAKTKEIDHEVISITMRVDDKVYSYGQFIASAHQLGFSSKIYQNVIDNMFKNPVDILVGKRCAIRVPSEYLTLQDTYERLENLFYQYGKDVPFKIIFEVPDILAQSNPIQMKLYKELFDRYGIEMGIYEFIGENAEYGYFQELKPTFIKAEASYFISQSEQAISSLKVIADTMDIDLIATSVMDKESLDKLMQKDIHIIQGRMVESL